MKKTYPGGKAGYGVYQKIINLIPEHTAYIETHLGGGAILRKKRPAKINIGIDIDFSVIKAWKQNKIKNTKFYQDNCISFLKRYEFNGNEFVYCDPPYLKKTRTCYHNRHLYRFEYTYEDHQELLDCIKKLNCMVIISGYKSELYEKELSGWNVKSFQAQTHSGKAATEYVWFNYAEPTILHDFRYLGDNFRERERIRKKADRWVNRFKSLPVQERQAIISKLKENGIHL
jgi:DNA adenine methylase